jgi:hypothetical protein
LVHLFFWFIVLEFGNFKSTALTSCGRLYAASPHGERQKGQERSKVTNGERAEIAFITNPF